MTAHDLTPVQEIAGMYFKRDDLYTPFGAGGAVSYTHLTLPTKLEV